MTKQSPNRPGDAGRKKILVVDDEWDIVMYLTTLFRENGYEALHAEDAQEAMRKILQDRPDLVCLDIMMPKQSGISLYRTLKLDERTRDIPAIFISAFGLAHKFKGEAFRKYIPDPEVPEPQAYLEKPVKPQTLLDIVKEVVG